MTARKLTIYTYDWLPEFPRGFVRDLRARWAAEETGRSYDIATVPVNPKSDAHRAMQPFAQVPMIEDGDVTLFETGAIALHLAEGTPLLPPEKRTEITQWVIAALNSVEPSVSNWMNTQMSKDLPQIFGPPASAELEAHMLKFMNSRLAALEMLMADREWIAGDFSAADIIMVDVLRVLQDSGALNNFPALTDYVERATARPAFAKAMQDHMAHWTAADAAKAN
ncbi:glutathione S-transferase family protein [Paracoccus sp. 11-3]|uniref:Glutathione S-transferase family protein n=1 Tax=Paracoccus amoyensis TaxID=2760093 RepID=A0A926GMF5_9RHOB|nr:glutathione S-transferase family protein [Paracoccus amoyensis]MBC9246590.1 glutathione S-transferase family protein [Paracoccus amoyensis]